MKKILGVCAISLALFAKEFGGFQSPESVYVDKGVVYVSNLGKEVKPLDKDQDGSIVRVDSKGKITPFATKLNAPKGMCVLKKTLYATDIDEIKGFDLKSGKQVFSLPIANAVFLNDLACQDDVMYVSDTGTGKIYKILSSTKQYELLTHIDLGYGGGPNGLLISQNQLYIATYDPKQKTKGMLLKMDLVSKTIERFSNLEGFLDGIAKDNQGNLLVSSWGENLNGKVFQVSPKGEIKEVTSFPIKGCADIFYSNGVIYIPAMLENKIITLP